MSSHFLQDIRYSPDKIALVKRAGLEVDSDEADDFLELLERIAKTARPKAFITTATVDATPTPPAIKLNGVEFSGTILYDNIKDAVDVWPYVVTCGVEMYNYVMAIPDPFERFWGEIVLEDALRTAASELEAFTAREIYSEKSAAIAPGSLEEWPISQQKPLFTLLGDGAKQCGVTLTDSLLMLPNKSISGIRFPSEHGYVSCKFCPREACPNRRVGYDPDSHP